MNSKSKRESNSYGNTIELNFLLTGRNLLLKTVVNTVCLWPFHVRTWECICLWPAFQKCQSLAYYGTGIWVCLADELNFTPRKNTLIPNRGRGAIFNLVGSFGINIKGPTFCPTISWRLEQGHNLKPSQNMQYVNDMCKRTDYVQSCKRANRIWWSPRQGSVWLSMELIKIGSVHMWLEWRRCSIKSKQLGLSSWPALLKFEVCHGSMSERV